MRVYIFGDDILFLQGFFMRSNQTCLASQPPTNHSLLGSLGLVFRGASFTKDVFFRWMKKTHIPVREF